MLVAHQADTTSSILACTRQLGFDYLATLQYINNVVLAILRQNALNDQNYRLTTAAI